MTELNAPIDIMHRISLTLLSEIRADLIALRQPDWEPAPMPESYRPSPDDLLYPGDEEFFYDYALGGQLSFNKPGTTTGVERR